MSSNPPNTNNKKNRRRSDYPFFLSYRTRWSDNDQYVHVNNAIYYHFFDAIVNTYIIQHLTRTDPTRFGRELGPDRLVVSSFCEFFSPLSFPDVLDLGLRVTRLGRSSVTYEVGVFKSLEGDETSASVDVPAAVGGYTHVFVDKYSRKSVAMNAQTRVVLEKLVTVTRPSNGAKL